MAGSLDPKDLPRTAIDRQRLAQELHKRAQGAFARGAAGEAAPAIADAILMFPNERPLLDTFDDIALSQADPLALFPEPADNLQVAFGAARARVLMMSQRLDEALGLLGRVLDVAPELGHIDWMRRWLAAPQVAAQVPWPLLAHSVVGPVLRLVAQVPVPTPRDDARLGNVRAAAEIFRQLLTLHRHESVLHAGLAMSLRRLGDPAAALAAAEDGVRAFPEHWGLRTTLMNALADSGRPADALEQARVALRLDPSDLSPLLDSARAYLAAERAAEAAALLQELLGYDPHFPNADAYLHYAHIKQSGSTDAMRALMYLRDRRPSDSEVQRMADELEPAVPYVNVLPDPPDMSAEFAREVIRELRPMIERCGESAQLSLEIVARYPEAPSIQLAFEYEAQRLGARHARIQVDVEVRPSPDPFADKGPVPLPVFVVQHGEVRPMRGEVDADLQHAIGNLAYQPFRRDLWDPAAYDLATKKGPSAVVAIAAVLNAPPPPPPDFDPLTWRYRCQVACALVLSHMGPWSTGPARGALYSLVSGPSDWVTIAGIVALSWRAHDSDAIRDEVVTAFQWLRSIIPADAGATWQAALIGCWLALGRHADNELADLAAWQDEYERGKRNANQVQAQRRYGGFTLEEYAWFVLERDRIAPYDYAAGAAMPAAISPPAELVALCNQVGVDPARPFVLEWHEALGANPSLAEAFAAVKRRLARAKMGDPLESSQLRTALRPTGSSPSLH